MNDQVRPEITLGSLRSDHEREHPLAPAKVTLVELELPIGGLVDLAAPLGTPVEIPLIRRWGHRARCARGAEGGYRVEVCVDSREQIVVMRIGLLVGEGAIRAGKPARV